MKTRRAGGLTRFWGLIEGQEGGGRNTGYYMILGSSLALTAIGLLMVLSSSSVSAISKESSSYGLFIRQGVFALVGVVLMLVLARMPVRLYRRAAWPLLGLALVLLLLVLTPLGVTVNGNRNWIELGGIRAQPAESAKLAMAIWGAHVLATKSRLVGDWKHALVPVVFPGAALILLFVLLGHDVGTLLVFVLIVATLLFLGGAPKRIFVLGGLAGIVGVIGVFAFSDNRMGRLNAWLQIDCEGNSACYQPMHGFYALASGGWWGVGLGQSRQKWNYLPEAQTDYILAIIGEELGLVGALVIVVLFAVMAIAMYRVAFQSHDTFVRVATGGIMAWFIGQAFINMGMVTGLLPVIGIPLPFISYGGNALVICLCAVGVVLAFARQSANNEPPSTTRRKTHQSA
ncbi:putative lipid II flippase FtsW [Zhihengliuella halotolerans]|uniref:putative lipid II flippase FtsW n=1 Tax=Zhihengliuella halotolerans TaxID=370736 RepID=UPI000C809FB7|nr:putative lipid II flippase FtsW [Zhihengliuella halotolerans]